MMHLQYNNDCNEKCKNNIVLISQQQSEPVNNGEPMLGQRKKGWLLSLDYNKKARIKVFPPNSMTPFPCCTKVRQKSYSPPRLSPCLSLLQRLLFGRVHAPVMSTSSPSLDGIDVLRRMNHSTITAATQPLCLTVSLSCKRALPIWRRCPDWWEFIFSLRDSVTLYLT